MTVQERKINTARRIAQFHIEYDPGVKHVFLLNSPNDAEENEPVRLLEVVEGTFEAGIYPVGFKADPAHGIDFPSVIIEVSPREFTGILESTPPEFTENCWSVGTELAAQ